MSQIQTCFDKGRWSVGFSTCWTALITRWLLVKDEVIWPNIHSQWQKLSLNRFSCCGCQSSPVICRCSTDGGFHNDNKFCDVSVIKIKIKLFSCHSSVFHPKCLEVRFKYMKYNLNLLTCNTSGISGLRANYAYSDIWLEKFNYLDNPLG